MVPPVSPEHGECLPVDVGVPETPGLDDGPDVGTLRLQLALQDSGRAPLGHLGEALGGVAVVGPDPESHSCNDKQGILPSNKR